MKRRFHWSLLAGFLLVLASMLTFPVFANIPATRSFGWVNLLLLVAGVALLFVSLTRSVRRPQTYRGRILSGILTTLSVLALGFFCVGIFYLGRVPRPQALQKAGDKAPEFSLVDQDGAKVSLRDLLASSQSGNAANTGALLIFYRGHW